jgi:hypothetical protein
MEEKTMRHTNEWLAIVLVATVLLLAGCSKTTPVAASGPPPAVVEKIEGTELNRLTLTEKAAQRLGIETASVREEQIDGTKRLVMPYSALIYDLEGGTWAYTSPENLIYVRQPVTVDYIQGDHAVLIDGLDAGATVVSVGVAELYGADTGIGK